MKAISLNLNNGYYSAIGYQSGTRLINIDGLTPTAGYTGDAHMDASRDTVVAISRQFMRNNPIYRGIIGRCVSYVVGSGFALQARTADNDWNKQAEATWAEFWESPEVRGTLSGKRYEALVFQELLATGDVFQAFVNTGAADSATKMQLFEAEQCVPMCPGSDNGLLVDGYGKPKAYNLVGYRNGYIQRGTTNIIGADNVIHLFEAERVSASRGLPALQSAFAMLHRINDICDAEAIARQMLAHLALSITRDHAQSSAYGESTEDPADSQFRIQELDYATIFHCRPGESITSVSRNIPGADFEKSMLMFLRVLGLPLGLPLEVIMLDWTKSNYSQSRAVLQQCFQTFSYWQSLLKKSLSRIYARKLTEWAIEGRIQTREDMSAHEWIAPSFPWIDEEKEIIAQAKKMELSIASHAEICKMTQHERGDVVAARDYEVRDAIERAQKIQEDTGVNVPWQIFAGLAAGGGRTPSPPAPEPEPEEVDTQEESETEEPEPEDAIEDAENTESENESE